MRLHCSNVFLAAGLLPTLEATMSTIQYRLAPSGGTFLDSYRQTPKGESLELKIGTAGEAVTIAFASTDEPGEFAMTVDKSKMPLFVQKAGETTFLGARTGLRLRLGDSLLAGVNYEDAFPEECINSIQQTDHLDGLFQEALDHTECKNVSWLLFTAGTTLSTHSESVLAKGDPDLANDIRQLLQFPLTNSLDPKRLDSLGDDARTLEQPSESTESELSDSEGGSEESGFPEDQMSEGASQDSWCLAE